jgi:hypothetical protein
MLPSVMVFTFAGSVLPKPFGNYNSLANGPLRAEVVLENVAATTTPCVLFVGDSRVAFGINAATLSTPACEARNYGYPTLGLEMAGDIIDNSGATSAATRTLVVGITEAMFPGRPVRSIGELSWKELHLGNVGSALLRIRFVMRVYLALSRFQHLVAMRPYVEAWPWRADLGRWSSSSLTERELAHLPSMDSEVRSMAQNYYGEHRPIEFSEYDLSWLRNMARKTNEVVLLILPSFPRFVEQAELIDPSRKRLFDLSVHDLADREGYRLLDCTKLENCGLTDDDFADPVHLNDKGAAALTKAVGQFLASNSNAHAR